MTEVVESEKKNWTELITVGVDEEREYVLSQENTISTNCTKFAAAFCAAQKSFGKAAKSCVNPHFKSKYADLEAVIDAVRGPLGENGLSFLQFPKVSEVTRNNRLTTEVNVVTVILHESGERVQNSLTLTGNEMGAQKAGSLISYCRRYSLVAALGISNGEGDDDGNAADGVGQEKPKQQPQSKPPEKPTAKPKSETKSLQEQAKDTFANPDLDLINRAKANLRQLGIATAAQAVDAVRQLCPELVFEGAVPWESMSPEQLRDVISAQLEAK